MQQRHGFTRLCPKRQPNLRLTHKSMTVWTILGGCYVYAAIISNKRSPTDHRLTSVAHPRKYCLLTRGPMIHWNSLMIADVLAPCSRSRSKSSMGIGLLWLVWRLYCMYSLDLVVEAPDVVGGGAIRLASFPDPEYSGWVWEPRTSVARLWVHEHSTYAWWITKFLWTMMNFLWTYPSWRFIRPDNECNVYTKYSERHWINDIIICFR